jgi:hypothetical protein
MRQRGADETGPAGASEEGTEEDEGGSGSGQEQEQQEAEERDGEEDESDGEGEWCTAEEDDTIKSICARYGCDEVSLTTQILK